MFIYEDEALKSIRHINHGFFGRTGGVSKGLYKSLNTAYSSHDDPENISQNREVIIGKLGAQQLSACQQVHSADIVNISAGNALSEPRPHADGMVTQTPGIALGIQTADCLPILAADKNKPVIGAVHSGWGGAFQGIASHMIKRMVANGANVEDIVVAIGPGIQQASYQVGQEFYDRFIGQHEKNKMFFEPSDKAGAFQFNLPGYVLYWLKHNYPNLAHISVSTFDTYKQENKFFSYRRTTHKGEDDYGRQMSAICLV